MFKLLKRLVSALIFSIFIILSYFISVRFLSQTYELLASRSVQDKNYHAAVTYLNKAIAYQGKEYFLWNKLGKTYYNSGTNTSAREAFFLAQKSKHAYQTAIQLNPIDAESFYGLSLSEARLEKLHPIVHTKIDNPYNAAPYFQKAIRLRPNSVSYHYAYVRYLHNKGKKKECMNVISSLVKIYPLSYEHLKKEPFWSPEIKRAVKKGLTKAIEEKINLHTAHGRLASILQTENDWKRAGRHYELALRYQHLEKHAGNYVHLGRLALKAGQFVKAEKNFLKALSISPGKKKTLGAIFTYYKEVKRPKELIQFYQKLTKKFSVPIEIDILLARSLADLKQYDQARNIFHAINEERPNAEAYYWLAKTAQRQQDFDGMELAIQKATVLEPKNSLYHKAFSRVLTRMHKFDRAEKEADLAIMYADDKKLPALYSHRASIKLRQKKYRSAIDDWKAAIELKPDNPRYFVNIANTYIRIGEKQDALTYYKKALDLDPNKANYQKRYQELLPE